MKYLRVNNWESFQHYKDRNPPWIKLHRDLLRDYEFNCLQDASKLQLMLIWLLASQMDNKIPADVVFIKSQLGIKGEVCLKELINKGFLVDDSGMLADCKQSAIVETETEAYSEEKEKERKKTKAKKNPPLNPPRGKCDIPDWINPNDWNDWVELRRKSKKPLTDRASELAVQKLQAFKDEGVDPNLILQQSILNGWQGLFPLRYDFDANQSLTEEQLRQKFGG